METTMTNEAAGKEPLADSAHGLTLRAVRCTPVEVPLRFPLGTSAATVTSAPLLLVEAETAQGVVGRTYVFCYRRSGARALIEVLEEAAGLVAGQPVAPLAIARTLERRYTLVGVTGLVRMALSALDMALWDALAIALGRPLASLLGAAPQPVRAYNSCGLGLMAPEAAAEEALKLLEGGFMGVKLRLGYPTLRGDLAAVRAVRAALPDTVALMVDYNQALSVQEAVERGRALQDEGVYWLEEPTRHDDWTGNARIARELDVPLQIGENFNGPQAMADAHAAQAFDYAMPDVSRIGGVSGWMQAAGLAAAAGVPLASHLMPEVSAHLLAASPTAHWLEYVDWFDAIASEPLRLDRGHVVIPPDRPGAGVHWDPDAVQRYRL
jgi:mandelate racemase